jgi:hypothetical protein
MMPDEQTDSPTIFLCHAREDFDRVLCVYKALKGAGLRPWLDKYDLVAGQHWKVAIEKAVKGADFFIAFFSSVMVNNPGYAHREYRLALDTYLERPPGSIFLIPVRLDDCEIPDLGDLGVRLSDLQWVDIFQRPPLTESDIEPILRAVEIQTNWRRPQAGLLKIIREYEGKVDEALMESMKVRELPYTDQIIEMRAKKNTQALTELGEKAFRSYLSSQRPGGGLEFYYLVATHLYRAIAAGDFSVCRDKPFIYPIHQYLSEMIRVAEPGERANALAALRRWLNSRDVYQTARDFAAFELGMCKAREARGDLMTALDDPFELPLVRYYAAMALGMIGSKDDLKGLADVYGREPHEAVREVIAHAIIHISADARRKV